MTRPCTWCADPNAEYPDDTLCRDHCAEAEGLTVDAMDRREAAEHADYFESLT